MGQLVCGAFSGQVQGQLKDFKMAGGGGGFEIEKPNSNGPQPGKLSEVINA